MEVVDDGSYRLSNKGDAMEIRFTSLRSKKVLGVVKLVNGKLSATRGVADVVDSWQGTPRAFIDNYSDWTNAYIRAQKVES
jgi:hypothetical protein